MKKRILIWTASSVVLMGVAATAVATGLNAKPQVICVMENPATGQRVEMFKEIWFKVPANYDEKKDIETWETEQRSQGYTAEVTN